MREALQTCTPNTKTQSEFGTAPGANPTPQSGHSAIVHTYTANRATKICGVGLYFLTQDVM